MEWYEPGPRVARPRARSRPGTGRPGTSYFCHSCQSSLRYLAEHGACPLCGGGFVEENLPSEDDESAVADVVQWLAGEEGFNGNFAVEAALDPTEARIDRMLADLQEQLNVLAPHGAASEADDDDGPPKTNPAPRRLLEMIREVKFDGPLMQRMRQTATCVVCCSDFEVGESLSQLPGCGHMFHGSCVHEWLGRRATCPICRCDLCEAVGIRSFTPSAPSSVTLDGDSHQDPFDSYRSDDMAESGYLSWGSLTIAASSRAFSEAFQATTRVAPGATVESGRVPPGSSMEVGRIHPGVSVGSLPRPAAAAPSPPPPPPQAVPGPPLPRRTGSAVLAGAGSLITSARRFPSTPSQVLPQQSAAAAAAPGDAP